jgi:alanine racemase
MQSNRHAQSPETLAWTEIDLAAIAHNVRELRRITRPNASLLVAVKANAYGHGAVQVAREALNSGADALGVARLEEAIALRDAGLTAPILIFGYTPPKYASELVAYDLAQAVYGLETAHAMSQQLRHGEDRVNVHLKIDTGMGRLGLLPQYRQPLDHPGLNIDAGAVETVQRIIDLPRINVVGLMTHFAKADAADKTYTQTQLGVLQAFNAQLRQHGIHIPIQHAANSGAIIDLPETHLDMVRAGIAVYGLPPSDEINCHNVHLQPAMALKSRIVHLKRVPAGFKISYGCTYTTERPTVIATVAIGYADGLSRGLSSRGAMLVRGRRVPIVGRVCMDLTMLDVGSIADIALEDEVVVFGSQSGATLSADELAAMLNTINYEVVATITARVPRRFWRSEQ